MIDDAHPPVFIWLYIYCDGIWLSIGSYCEYHEAAKEGNFFHDGFVPMDCMVHITNLVKKEREKKRKRLRNSISLVKKLYAVQVCDPANKVRGKLQRCRHQDQMSTRKYLT